MVQPVHPFPARMAPGLALESLQALPEGSVVLDPMVGSGTVLREATDLGHGAIGFDMDPLAVLMSSVWTTPVKDAAIATQYAKLLRLSWSAGADDVPVTWIDENAETAAFTEFWFAAKQRAALRRIAAAAAVLHKDAEGEAEQAAVNVLRLALSRIIVTKEQAASLARDTSHSRPHRVATTSDYDVFAGFDRSLKTLRKRLNDAPPSGGAAVTKGDARQLAAIENNSVDAVITSPPYLNAIDYLRGHRLALVWLGWTVPQIRQIRSASIGAERSPDDAAHDEVTAPLVTAMVGDAALENRHRAMIKRYAVDLHRMVYEVARVIKVGGYATFVVGNSCLKGAFIKNADGVAAAAKAAGLTEVARSERDLPQANRYLPVTGENLAKRMRTETVLKFAA